MILISATITLPTTTMHRLVLVSEIILGMTKCLQKLPFVDIIYHVNNSQPCTCASCCNQDAPELNTKLNKLYLYKLQMTAFVIAMHQELFFHC